MKITHFAGFLALCLLALSAGCRKAPEPDAESVARTLRTANRLYVAEYVVHKIITADDVKRLNGRVFNKPFSLQLPVGARKIAIPVDAVVKGYIDFSAVEPSDIKIFTDPKRIMVTLPQPLVALTSSKIDHKEIKEYTELFRFSFTDAEMSELERQGRQAIIEAIPAMGIEETARRNARDLLVPVLMQAGFEPEQIHISFKQPINPQ